MACQVPPVEQLTNNQTLINVDQLAQSAAAEIATELGIALTVGDTIIPLAPFIWAAIGIQEIIGLFGGGRPKFQDTQAVIDAYNQSQYWMLHALATDLAIAEKNGAPISDSNPAIQAQFSAWKQGTIESFQQQAGFTPGPQSPGYWQLQELINTSWVYSKGGVQAVLQVVRAMDCFFEVLVALHKAQTTQPPPGGGGGGGTGGGGSGGGGGGDGLSGDLIQELIACLCDETSDECCTEVVAAIAKVAAQLAIIAKALTFGGHGVPNPPTTPDLSAIVNELAALVTAVGAIGGGAAIDLTPLVQAVDNVAAAIGKGSAVDVAGIVEQLKRRNDDLQVANDWTTQLINSGAVPADLVPLLQGTTWDKVRDALGAIVGYSIGAGIADPTTAGGRIFAQIVLPFARAMWRVVEDILPAFGIGVSNGAGPLASEARNLVSILDNAVTTLFGGAATAVLEGYESGIAGIDTTTDAGVSAVIQILMGRAFELGMGAHWFAVLPELAYFTKQVGFNRMAALLAEMAGFHEVMIAAHRPFMTAALARPATYTTNRKYPNTLPAFGIGMNWYSRRKMAQADAQYLASSAGFNTTWQAPMLAAAYRPISPRALATAIQDTPFPKAEMQDILEDNGFSDAHVAFMLQVLEYNSTKNVRNAYVTEAIAAYKAGVMPDSELDDILNSVGWSDTAKQFVRSRALLQRRVTLAAEAEKNIVAEVAGGGMTADVGLQQLEAAGIEPWYAQLQITLAETKASIHALRVAEAEARRTLLAEQRNLTRAAVAEFQRGVFDLAGLTAALAGIGLDPTLVASIVAVQDATRTGRMRLLYGRLLSPSEARLLEERIAAIGQQTKDQLITLEQALAQLTQLGVDSTDAHALVARWAAALKKSAGSAQLISPP